MKIKNQEPIHKMIAFADIGDRILFVDEAKIVWEVNKNYIKKADIDYKGKTITVAKPKFVSKEL